MKKILALALVLLAAGSVLTVFAQPGPGFNPQTEAAVTVTGKIAFEDGFHVELISGEKRYDLMQPRYLVTRFGLKENDEITVTGYPTTRYCRSDGDDEEMLFISTITVGGKEYSLENERGWRGRPGRRGMMDGYGGRFRK